MTASPKMPDDHKGKDFLPDGRQTRIEFASGKHKKSESRGGHGKKQSFEWWHALTGWMKSTEKEQEHQLEAFDNFLVGKKYSAKTRRSYMFMLKKFFSYLDEQELKKITFNTIEDYNYEFFVSGKYSRSYQLQFINSLSHYLEFTNGMKVNLKGLRRPASNR